MKNVSRYKPIYISLILMTFAGSACNEATFTGNNPSRAQDEATADVFCEFTPARLNVGEKANLNVRFQGPRPAQIFQSVSNNGRTDETELVLTGGELAPQEFSAAASGRIEVALRLQASDTEPVATCVAEVEAPQPQTLACSIAPDVLEIGNKATVNIETSGVIGSVFQTLSYRGEKKVSELVRDGAEYIAKNGSKNSIDVDTEGSVQIELRLSPEGEIQATCQASVIAPPVCEDKESIGAHIAFLIDNSNSNAATDCPAATKIGTHSNVGLYECGEKTNRERAVEAAFGLLQSIHEKEPDQLDSLSELAIVSFPTKDDFIDGFKRETPWLAVEASNKQVASEALQFARRPYGLTPYGAAFSGATELFSGLEASGKAQVAVLVTDGEPTDKDPNGVMARAKALRDQGVKVITVFVTGEETRGSRRTAHTDMMRGIDASSVNADKGHWYTDAYENFAAYTAALTGDATNDGLVERISDEIVEVENSDALTAVFQNIIKTRVIRCEDR